MRKLISTTFLSLDGVMQAPGGPEEDASGKFELGGWSFPFWNDAINEFMGEAMGKEFDLVLGRKTYDIFASFWPQQDDNPGAKSLNDAAKYVASRGTPNLSWNNSHLIDGDLIDAIKSLKQTDGPELQVHGSSDLLQSLISGGVIDEMRMITYPVVLGSGKRLFGEGAVPTTLKPIKTSVADNGVILAVYAPAGEVILGDFTG